MSGIYIPHLNCIDLYVTESKYISQVNVKCYVHFWIQVHRSIGSFYSKSNYTVHSVQFTIFHKFSISRQIIKPQGQWACLILDTISVCQWHFSFTQIKMIKSYSQSNCCFCRHAILLVSCSSHLFCRIIASSFPPVSISCLKYHPFSHLYISFSCWLS